MAAAHMQRQPFPSLYHTPQSSSPASVASPQGHDQHGRPGMYGQPQSQMGQPMYYNSYQPMNQVHPSPYAQHPGPPQAQPQPHQNLTSQPMLMSHQQNPPPLQHQQPPQTPTQGMASSPRNKMEPSSAAAAMQQRSMDTPGSMQRPQGTPMTNNGSVTAATPPTANGMHHQNMPNSAGGGGGAGGVNSNAAPGPIPATTPLVVRQDNNGVQWIAFEYSRDRVKMEYTIRCDVESVQVDSLSQDFKQENCVYPRACCTKEMYRGNRLIYETECNTVGWALADLNPCLRGKRGLIQRAVDSWRNSNQDPKLRSRRVRRQAKMNNRGKQQPVAHLPGHAGPMGGASSAAAAAAAVAGTMPQHSPMSAGPSMQAPPQARGPPGPGGAPGQPGGMPMGASAQQMHHHQHPDGQAQGDDPSGMFHVM